MLRPEVNKPKIVANMMKIPKELNAVLKGRL